MKSHCEEITLSDGRYNEIFSAGIGTGSIFGSCARVRMLEIPGIYRC